MQTLCWFKCWNTFLSFEDSFVFVRGEMLNDNLKKALSTFVGFPNTFTKGSIEMRKKSLSCFLKHSLTFFNKRYTFTCFGSHCELEYELPKDVFELGD